ncbi:F5/8 type C domain containing protein [Trichomonas vaginalis G3]|uniref:F5/8 type C domain containing protein n=1 Tax=Trichomonas vaginalis (strain ATCC PRA-98 / G3) TaxID=412133 RepID=A2DLD0_TRIV3|nr:protein ubiquitination [Trichomonas vaginalis G3]EAY18748.1 F5/8 type C domain containing protein [Trichomonas vaginalis G3]KAI5539315.1 protein ubiquitination [Trichomonas vaginalis G3]|eukprot:XP_001579734.1 F5/8 type C domain containing protein [Trichomonas vaginalis G3]
MSQNQFHLTTNGLQNIQIANIPNDFAFIVGDHTYPTNLPLACFISPRVCREHVSDTTTNSLTINVDDSDYQFKSIVDLMNGKTLDISENNVEYLKEIGMLLENFEIVEKSLQYKFSISPITLENVMDRLTEMVSCKITHQETIEFARQHFPEIEYKNLEKASPDALFYLFSLEKLRTVSEDYLFELAYKLVTDHGSKLFRLFESILFEFVSTENMKKFISIADPNEITGRLWASISKRLEMKVFPDWKSETRHIYSSVKENEVKRTMERLYYDDKKEWNGIIQYLWRKNNENPHNAGLIFIGVSSTYNGVHQQSVIDLSWDNYWYSTNEKNSYFSVDFLKMLVVPRSVEIRNGKSGYSLKSWVIEGSNDGINFDILDEHESCLDFKPKYTTKVYQLNNPDNKEYRIIRLRQTSVNNNGSMALELSRFEIYGDLILLNE